MRFIFLSTALLCLAASPFETHGKLRVAKSGTFIEHADGTPFFILADTCWTGPALSGEADWAKYLADRKAKGFTAIQFNMVSPWRTAPTDAEGNTSYTIDGGKLVPNEKFYQRLDARMKAITDAGLLAMPVLCWAHKSGDAGVDLSEEHLLQLISFQVQRYQQTPALWILVGDNTHTLAQGAKWKRIGRAVFEKYPQPLVTTHPTGMNWPWKGWEDEKWLTVLGYQSGHGDDGKSLTWTHSGPASLYARSPTRPVLNLEPPYEGHNGYKSKKPFTDAEVRRSIYWSLLVHSPCGVTYGGHGVWSWHTQPGKPPTDHASTGVAKVWNEAIDLPGAGQMIHLRTIFASVDWSNLIPRPDLLNSQPGRDEPAKFIAVAQTHGRSQIVAYIPVGAAIDLHGIMKPTDSLTWWNPADGTKQSVATQPDTTHDWVLVIKR